MVYVDIRLITFFAVEEGEALYYQQKPDLELTVVQVMSSKLQNTDLNRKNGLGKTIRPFRYDLNLMIIQYR